MVKRWWMIAMMVGMCCLATAQNKARMQQYEDDFVAFANTMATASTDNERYFASESALEILEAALKEEDSFKWKWTVPQHVSVLTSADNILRFFTWAVIRDGGEYECFGVVQYYNSKEEEYQYQVLHDRSDEIINREESVLSADNWFGAVYQELIQTTAAGKTYYTLLGWHGVDNITERKVIEPVTLRAGNVQFGAAMFRRERNIRRIVLEYTNEAMVHLGYEVQTIREIEKERVKDKSTGRYRTIDKVKEHKEKMIVFDEVEPQIQGMDGLFQYYVPSGNEVAYAFVDGKWEQRSGAQGRLTDKKLNKPFEPLEKASPNYKY